MKVALVSDTHGTRPEIPPADLLIHCGDICPHGELVDYIRQLNWLKSIKDNYPLGVALSPGNHDCVIEEQPSLARLEARCAGIQLYIDEAAEIGGVKFYFSPWTPEYYNWAFMKPDDALTPKWDAIPNDTQFLVTHGPARHFLDYVPRTNEHVGSRTLGIRTYQLEHIKIHACGHIHSGYGRKRVDEKFWAINASVLNEHYQMAHAPIVVDTDTWDIIDTLGPALLWPGSSHQ